MDKLPLPTYVEVFYEFYKNMVAYELILDLIKEAGIVLEKWYLPIEILIVETILKK